MDGMFIREEKVHWQSLYKTEVEWERSEDSCRFDFILFWCWECLRLPNVCPSWQKGHFSSFRTSPVWKGWLLGVQIDFRQENMDLLELPGHLAFLSFVYFITFCLFTAFNQSLASFRCPLCMSPSPAIRPHTCPLCFKCSSFASCEPQVPVFLFLRRHTRVCC